MKKLYIIPIFLMVLAGCAQFDMQFKPTQNLKSQYDQSSSDGTVTLYYNIKKSAAGQTFIQIAIQNTAKIYMKNLTINYDNCCQAISSGKNTYLYKNLGNLKNRAHKTMTLTIPSADVKTVTLDYSYVPVAEDSFLHQTSEYNAPVSEVIKNRIILYIGK